MPNSVPNIAMDTNATALRTC